MSMHSLKSSELSSESELLLKYCISVCVCVIGCCMFMCVRCFETGGSRVRQLRRGNPPSCERDAPAVRSEKRRPVLSNQHAKKTVDVQKKNTSG